MKVNLIDVDSKFSNLALMKISAYHKSKGDNVSFYNPLFDRPDIIYSSKIFKFTEDYGYYPEGANLIKGGTGYGKTFLPEEIDKCFPDYSIYPDHDYAIGFTSRGCPRKCDFCVVPKIEGKIRATGDIYNFWNGQKKIVLLDNNLSALPQQFHKITDQILQENIKVDFSQGLDIRLIDDEMAKKLSKLKLSKQIHFAFDDLSVEPFIRKGIETLNNNGVKPYKLMFFILIGFNSTHEEDIKRIEILRSLNVDSFVMPYDKTDPYQKHFARWVNHKAVFKSVSFEEYMK